MRGLRNFKRHIYNFVSNLMIVCNGRQINYFFCDTYWSDTCSTPIKMVSNKHKLIIIIYSLFSAGVERVSVQQVSQKKTEIQILSGLKWRRIKKSFGVIEDTGLNFHMKQSYIMYLDFRPLEELWIFIIEAMFSILRLKKTVKMDSNSTTNSRKHMWCAAHMLSKNIRPTTHIW